jgi:recombinational DNA repair protein RecT
MSNQLTIIKDNLLAEQQTFTSYTGDGEKYALSVYNHIMASQGDPKLDLTKCEPKSLVQCAIQAAQMQIPFDNRKLAAIVPYQGKAQLQIMYGAYIDRLKRNYPDAQVIVEPVCKGDNFEMHDTGGYQTYVFTPDQGNLFLDLKIDSEKLLGYFVAISYTESTGEKRSLVQRVSVGEIKKAKAAAKQTYVWDKWFAQQAAKTAIRRAFKVLFFGMFAELDAVDNDNYDIEPIQVSAKGQDRLNVFIPPAPVLPEEFAEPPTLSADNHVGVVEAEVVDSAPDIDLEAELDKFRGLVGGKMKDNKYKTRDELEDDVNTAKASGVLQYYMDKYPDKYAIFCDKIAETTLKLTQE